VARNREGDGRGPADHYRWPDPIQHRTNRDAACRPILLNTVAAAEKYRIPHQILSAQDIRSRFPQFHVRDDELGYYEPSAGYLRPEACVEAQLQLARKYGAAIHTNEKVLSFQASRDEVTITTGQRSYRAAKLIVSAGAWLPGLLAERYATPFKSAAAGVVLVRRERSGYAVSSGELSHFHLGAAGTAASDLWISRNRRRGGRCKIATQQYEHSTAPETVNRDVSEEEAAAMHAKYVAPYLPDLSSRCIKGRVMPLHGDARCGIRHRFSSRVEAYHRGVALLGHGFKHSAAIGEALAELAVDGKSRFDLSAFRFSRFTK